MHDEAECVSVLWLEREKKSKGCVVSLYAVCTKLIHMDREHIYLGPEIFPR